MYERESLPLPSGRDMLQARRRFLKVLGAASVMPLLGAGAASAAIPGLGTGLRETLGAAPAVIPGPGGVFLVNGWVLTGADLDALGLRAA